MRPSISLRNIPALPQAFSLPTTFLLLLYFYPQSPYGIALARLREEKNRRTLPSLRALNYATIARIKHRRSKYF